MRTKTLKKNKINVVTLGCSKNVYDSEVLMGQLRANNKEVVHEEEGNVVVDMTGRSYNVEELAQYLDNEEIEVLLSRPEMYFVRVDRETNTPTGIGPE